MAKLKSWLLCGALGIPLTAVSEPHARSCSTQIFGPRCRRSTGGLMDAASPRERHRVNQAKHVAAADRESAHTAIARYSGVVACRFSKPRNNFLTTFSKPFLPLD